MQVNYLWSLNGVLGGDLKLVSWLINWIENGELHFELLPFIIHRNVLHGGG